MLFLTGVYEPSYIECGNTVPKVIHNHYEAQPGTLEVAANLVFDRIDTSNALARENDRETLRTLGDLLGKVCPDVNNPGRVETTPECEETKRQLRESLSKLKSRS
jgi:hypothetical protein